MARPAASPAVRCSFVLTLKKGRYTYQFGQYAWTHMILMVRAPLRTACVLHLRWLPGAACPGNGRRFNTMPSLSLARSAAREPLALPPRLLNILTYWHHPI